MRCASRNIFPLLLIFFFCLQVSRKLDHDSPQDDAQMAAIRQVVHAMAARRSLPHAQFAARLARKKVCASAARTTVA